MANIRAIFNKYRGELGKNGSLEFLFKRVGIFELDKKIDPLSEEELEMSLIDGGLEEFDIEDQSYFFTTSFENFGLMQKKLEEINLTPKVSKLERIPIETKKMTLGEAKVILNMIEKFEEDEDVQEVFHTLTISEN